MLGVVLPRTRDPAGVRRARGDATRRDGRDGCRDPRARRSRVRAGGSGIARRARDAENSAAFVDRAERLTD